MRTIVAAVVLVVLSLTPSTRLDANRTSGLQALNFLAGSCWKGTFPNGKSTDTHCFEWVFGDKFIRDRHHNEGGSKPYAGETLYSWDAKRSVVNYTYWNSLGAISTGTMTVADDGSLNFPEQYVKDGKVLEMNNVWRRLGADEYAVVVTEKQGGQWVESWRMTLRRQVQTGQR